MPHLWPYHSTSALREETANHPMAGMQISPEQGHLMALLVRILGARKTLEVGVFTGYSAMVVAKAIGPKGKVVALDVGEEFTTIDRCHWAKAGVADRIDLRQILHCCIVPVLVYQNRAAPIETKTARTTAIQNAQPNVSVRSVVIDDLLARLSNTRLF